MNLSSDPIKRPHFKRPHFSSLEGSLEKNSNGSSEDKNVSLRVTTLMRRVLPVSRDSSFTPCRVEISYAKEERSLPSPPRKDDNSPDCSSTPVEEGKAEKKSTEESKAEEKKSGFIGNRKRCTTCWSGSEISELGDLFSKR